MICARIVSNNRHPDDAGMDGIPLFDIESIKLDDETGKIILRGRDMALDPVQINAPFGWTIEVYH